MKKNRKPRPQPPKWAWMAVGFRNARGSYEVICYQAKRKNFAR